MPPGVIDMLGYIVFVSHRVMVVIVSRHEKNSIPSLFTVVKV